MSHQFKADFSSRKLDEFLTRWIAGGLSAAELAEWEKILGYDTKFREQFCDWIKCLREPAWSTPSNTKGRVS